MRIYIPTEITTEAEAEVLPHGTKVFHEDVSVREPVPYLYVKREDGSFVGWQGDILYLDEIVPCTALVPVEVEERTETRTGWLVRTPGGVRLQVPYQGRPEDSLTDSEEPQEYTTTRWATGWRKTS